MEKISEHMGGDLGKAHSWIFNSGGTLAALDIDFVNNKAWNGTASSIASLLTCSRASYEIGQATSQRYFLLTDQRKQLTSRT